jgi:hypothetical protein
MKKYVTDLSKHLLEHWAIYLLGSGGVVTTVLSWLYRSHLRDWLLSKHSIGMLGWMWVASVLIVGALPIFVFWLCKKMRRRILYRNDEEISVVLEHKLRKYANQKQNEILIDFRECDRKWHFPKGSAQRLLPLIVEKDKTWRIKSKSGNSMTIIREAPEEKVKKTLESYYKK